ncbi:MAG: ATP-binding protein [Candidatus Omnitrophota bacterium]|nr:ATP-binding protein [Candidatus Omnitrophota bacterium]
MKTIKRAADIKKIRELTGLFPIVAIQGPRQCGKTFLTHELQHDHWFDLESSRDAVRLSNPQMALEKLKGTIVIDEAQCMPELFPLLRYLVDYNKGQRYFLLGSASFNMMKKSSESLAGRIGFYYLDGFSLDTVGVRNWEHLWLVGGFPKAYLMKSPQQSFGWLDSFITAFLEKDVAKGGVALPPLALRRFWTMLSHYHGQVLNYSEIGRAFGLSDMTVRRYIEILTGTYMVRLLQPWYVNIGKRLIKHPKLYIRDTGVLHTLLSIESQEQLLSHNMVGASWEGFVLETAIKVLSKRAEEVYFWGMHETVELDLFWQQGGKNWGLEVKYQDAPEITKSMRIALKVLKLEKLWVVYPGPNRYKLDDKVEFLPLAQIAVLNGKHRK